jgi:hypothetical protein
VATWTARYPEWLVESSMARRCPLVRCPPLGTELGLGRELPLARESPLARELPLARGKMLVRASPLARELPLARGAMLVQWVPLGRCLPLGTATTNLLPVMQTPRILRSKPIAVSFLPLQKRTNPIILGSGWCGGSA